MCVLRLIYAMSTVLLAMLFLGPSAWTMDDRTPAGEALVKFTIKIGYLTRTYDEPPPLSLVDKVLTDNGVQGTRVGLKYNEITGRLIGYRYELIEKRLSLSEDIAAAAEDLFEANVDFVVADLEPADLLAVADLSSAKDKVIFNIRTSDDRLRGKDCRSNVFHIIPSVAQRTDALAQFLIWKKWRRWFVVAGKRSIDQDYVAAIKRSAKRFGGKIVEQRSYEFEGGNRRADDGHQQIQTQMPALTRSAAGHDVVFVSDASETFGDYLQWRTTDPRPVVGTHGLVAASWHRSFEQYAGMQMQNRFERLVGRTMTERDYAGWLSVRVVGEAVLRAKTNDLKQLRNYILSDSFKVAGFKGRGMTFRKWDHQLRQPMLLTGPRTLVSISPQPGFLHHKDVTDTLGFDQSESACRF